MALNKNGKFFIHNILVVFSICSISCSTTAVQLKSNMPATATKLDNKFQVLAHLGQLPQVIKESDAVARFSVSASGFPAEYLVVISPQQIKEDLEVKFKQSENHIDSIPQYHDYLNRVLSVHRAILKGEVNEAKAMLNKIRDEYNITYGYLVLASTIAALDGQSALAGEYIKKALEIYPESIALKDFKDPGIK